MTTALDTIRVELAISREALLQEAALVPDDELDVPPSEGAWSTSEILDHLGVVENRICNGFEKTVAGAPAAEPDYVEPNASDAINAVMKVLQTEGAGPLKSTVAPERGKSRTELVQALGVSRSRLLGLIDDAQGRDLSGRSFPHPIFGELDLYQWLVFVARHDDRHRAQITRLRQSGQ